MDDDMQNIYTINFIVDNLLKFTRGGHPVSFSDYSRRFKHQFLSFLAQEDINLVTIPFSDKKKMEIINNWLNDNGIVYVHFSHNGKVWNPISASYALKSEFHPQNIEDYLIIPAILNKKMLRKTLRDVFLKSKFYR